MCGGHWIKLRSDGKYIIFIWSAVGYINISIIEPVIFFYFGNKLIRTGIREKLGKLALRDETIQPYFLFIIWEIYTISVECPFSKWFPKRDSENIFTYFL